MYYPDGSSFVGGLRDFLGGREIREISELKEFKEFKAFNGSGIVQTLLLSFVSFVSLVPPVPLVPLAPPPSSKLILRVSSLVAISLSSRKTFQMACVG